MDFQAYVDFLSGLSYTRTGAKRAERIWKCTTRPEDPEGVFRLEGWSCRDAMCPRCRKSTYFRVAEICNDFKGLSYFQTFTWRESAVWGGLQELATKRRRYITVLSRVAGVERFFWSMEFTLSPERIHLHYHTVIAGEKESKVVQDYFNSVGERYCDRKEYDGNSKELAKYLTPTYSELVGRLLGEVKGLRTKGGYGLRRL